MICGPPPVHRFQVSVVEVESAGSLVYLPFKYAFAVPAFCKASWAGGKSFVALAPVLSTPPVADIVTFAAQSVGRLSISVLL